MHTAKEAIKKMVHDAEKALADKKEQLFKSKDIHGWGCENMVELEANKTRAL